MASAVDASGDGEGQLQCCRSQAAVKVTEAVVLEGALSSPRMAGVEGRDSEAAILWAAACRRRSFQYGPSTFIVLCSGYL